MFSLPLSINGFLNYLFITARVSGILFTAPVYGSFSVDPRLRLFFSFILGYILYSLIPDVTLEYIDTLLLFIIIIKELLIGIALGLLGQFIFAGIMFGGHVIGFQMGFVVVDVIDPQSNVQASVVAQFQNILMILIFISIGGHLMIIKAIADSFDIVGLGSFMFSRESFLYIVKYFSYIFVIAIKLVAPVFVTMIIVHVIMGIIGRLVPQINLLIVGFPLQIAVGLIMLGFSLKLFYIAFEPVIQDYFKNIYNVLKLIGG
ncbi:MAG: flagellar biosynthetic protein FliR [Deferribacterota bacterium]|nr:flagellar biosynthetic protein FliR [Deferribacterota bacterium]